MVINDERDDAYLMATLGLTGCVTISISGALTQLEDALDVTPTGLESRAGGGDARAQYSLSIVYRYGLDGAERDSGHSRALRRKALASQGYT